ADCDAEDALSAADEVDDLVVRGAQVDTGSVAHERGTRKVVHPRLMELRDGGADLLQGDARVEQSLHELEHEDVAEAVEALRSGSLRTADRGLDEARACPVVELTIGDARSAGRRGAFETALLIGLRQPV